MNLCIDIGNSRSKLAVFSEEGELLQLVTRERFSQKKLDKVLKKYPIRQAILSSVRRRNSRIERQLSGQLQHFVRLNWELALPIENSYATPETLGNDRIAAVVAAHSLFPDSNVLVIDAGTCITYDFITEGGNYLGGSILAGIEMRFSALAHFTAKLPLVQRIDLDQEIGNTTLSSIQTGVQSGVVYEMQGFIAQYQKEYPELRVLITGGDADFFEKRLSSQLFKVPNLVLMGLNQILNYHVQQHTAD